MYQDIHLTARVPDQLGNERLDRIAAALFPDYSRVRLQQWIRSGELTVDGSLRKIKDRLYGGELLEIQARLEVTDDNEAQDVAFDVVHEDEHIVVINKPVGLVTHPAPGNRDKTLLNGLLFRYPELDLLPRAGIVHRLDKDTSGLMVVARNLVSQNKLVNQLQSRTVTRTYEAVVYGVVRQSGTVNKPIGRHVRSRKKMAIRDDGKEAITHYKVLRAYPDHTHLVINLETGRTHQIRVHLSYLRHPLVGDPTYGGTFRIPAQGSSRLREVIAGFNRQALHAVSLEFDHPHTGIRVRWGSELPPDMRELLEALNQSASENS